MNQIVNNLRNPSLFNEKSAFKFKVSHLHTLLHWPGHSIPLEGVREGYNSSQSDRPVYNSCHYSQVDPWRQVTNINGMS